MGLGFKVYFLVIVFIIESVIFDLMFCYCVEMVNIVCVGVLYFYFVMSFLNFVVSFDYIVFCDILGRYCIWG